MSLIETLCAEHQKLEQFVHSPIVAQALGFFAGTGPRRANPPRPRLRELVADSNGEERWMPESADIVRYLQASYGQAAA